MGGAIALGLAGGSSIAPRDITVSGPHLEKLEKFKVHYKDIRITASNRDAVQDADLVIVAVKPWLLEEVLSDLESALDYSHQALASVVAGVSFEALGQMLDRGDGIVPPLYRIIPNTAVSIGESVTFIASSGVDEVQKEEIVKMFGELGIVQTVEEDMVRPGTSLASCGIAFALQYVDASIRGGIELGFSPEEARAIVMQTVRGALGMLSRNGTMPRTEIDKVTTPGGYTLKGLQTMAEARFDEAVIAGLKGSR